LLDKDLSPVLLKQYRLFLLYINPVEFYPSGIINPASIKHTLQTRASSSLVSAAPLFALLRAAPIGFMDECFVFSSPDSRLWDLFFPLS
jgi:hypothetical protein